MRAPRGRCTRKEAVKLKSVVFFLLMLTLVLLGFAHAQVPVPDRLGTSRDWTAPENEALFQPVEAEVDASYGATVYNELGKQTYRN